MGDRAARTTSALVPWRPPKAATETTTKLVITNAGTGFPRWPAVRAPDLCFDPRQSAAANCSESLPMRSGKGAHGLRSCWRARCPAGSEGALTLIVALAAGGGHIDAKLLITNMPQSECLDCADGHTQSNLMYMLFISRLGIHGCPGMRRPWQPGVATYTLSPIDLYSGFRADPLIRGRSLHRSPRHRAGNQANTGRDHGGTPKEDSARTSPTAEQGRCRRCNCGLDHRQHPGAGAYVYRLVVE